MHTKLSIIILLNTVTVAIHLHLEEFPVYWNVPTKHCFNKNISIPLEEYGIIYNKDHDFKGDQIVLFYEYDFGYFPYFNNSDPKQPVNGGLPQKCPIWKHLLRVSEQIRVAIPREDFAGIAVIDIEEWRPLYHLNWGRKKIYKSESIQLIREQYPNISYKSADELARKEFNAYARKIFLSTIGLAKRLRPYAKWGFYGFPYCNYGAGSQGDSMCNEQFRAYNDELSFITNSGNAIFPSIYLANNDSHIEHFRYIQAIMMECQRVAAFSNPPLPIFPYDKFEYKPYEFLDSFYSKRDLCNSLKQASDLGARGLILWSSSKNMPLRCKNIAEYIRKRLGPTVALVRKRVQRCRDRRCTGNGQCVLRRPASKCNFRMQSKNYVCQCDSLFVGEDCGRHQHFRWMFGEDIMDGIAKAIPTASSVTQIIDNFILNEDEDVSKITAELVIFTTPLLTENGNMMNSTVFPSKNVENTSKSFSASTTALDNIPAFVT